MNRILNTMGAALICAGASVAQETNAIPNEAVVITNTPPAIEQVVDISPSSTNPVPATIVEDDASYFLDGLTNGLTTLNNLLEAAQGLSFVVELDVASRDVYQGFSPSDVSPSTMFFNINLSKLVGVKGLGWMSNDDFDMAWWELSPYIALDFDFIRFETAYTYKFDCEEGRDGFFDGQYIDFNISMNDGEIIPFYWAFNVEWDIDDEDKGALYYDLTVGKCWPTLFAENLGLSISGNAALANSTRNNVDYGKDEVELRDGSITISIPWDVGAGVYCRPYIRYTELFDEDARDYARLTSVGHHSWQVVGGVVVGMTF